MRSGSNDSYGETTSRSETAIDAELTFCTTCMGRLLHLRQTLPLNLAEARPFGDRVRFILLDYHSRDGLEAWVREELASVVAAGQLTVYRTRRPTHYHSAHAKNVAHLLANSRILVNLDADNFLRPGCIQFLLAAFREDLHQVCHGRRCAQGRIALTRDDFFALGGYDEDFHGWGEDDTDLLQRAAAGLHRRVRRLARFDRYLDHSDELRMAEMPTRDALASQSANRRLMEANLARRAFVANAGRAWGVETVERNYVPDDLVHVGRSAVE